ncbi:MAG: hypothetical protein COX78_03010, partial [Candidatus Levybacteria bacterium CG_4_10_14_0_2_um_filter_35_8]
MKLRYKVATKEGKIIQGLIDAKEISEAANYLRNKDYMVIKIERKDPDSVLKILSVFNKPKTTDLVLFTRQLSSMLQSGLTLMRALEILRDQIQNQAMAEVISGIITDIEGGKTLSSALIKYPDVFSRIYISLIKA